MTYNLTLTLNDERGTTTVKLMDVPENRLRESPPIRALLELHEQMMPEGDDELPLSEPATDE